MRVLPGFLPAILLLLSAAPAPAAESGLLVPVSLRTEMQQEPLAVDRRTPRLSWTLAPSRTGLRNLHQSAYRVQVAVAAPRFANAARPLWDSGRVASDAYSQRQYSGPPLRAQQQYFWRVMVWDDPGRASAWSAPASFSTGMMDGGDWKARWIEGEETGSALPVFRNEFAVTKPLSRAVVYVSGLGQYELRVNGKDVTQDVLTPGWTDYRKTVLYNTYDITGLLRSGTNAFGVLLGNGMYNVAETPGRYTKFVGSFGKPKVIVQALLRYRDGTEETIVSDRRWRTHAGPILFSSTYGGEDFDATKLEAGWDLPGFPASAWANATEVASPGGALTAEMSAPVRVLHTFKPVRVGEPRPGVLVYDLRQNFSGWPEISVLGHAGETVRLTPGELLDAAGLVTQRSANASPKDAVSFSYTLRGGGRPEVWHPRFTYYGFRYVQVEGAALPSKAKGEGLKILSLEGQFLHADLPENGEFSSSEGQFNRIHRLIDMAILSNAMSVLTDCPHREKLGWLEQTYLNGSSIFFNYGAERLYEKMAHDMADAQLASGMVPGIAPEYAKFVDEQGRNTSFRDSPEWGSAIILSPWTSYQFTGDRDSLERSYEGMVRYAGWLRGRSKDHLLSYGLGDWYDIGPKEPGESQLTSKMVTATATYYEDLVTLAEIARVLAKPGDAERFAAEAGAVKSAYNAALFHADTDTYDKGSQTANAMALVLHLVPAGHERGVLENLIGDIQRHQNHVTAGDIGFHYVVRALTETGRPDVLYAMLMRNDSPSYGYQLQRGATTLTEAWDTNPADSQNHFMLGHAEEWFYRGLAGINVDMAAKGEHKRIRIAPQPVREVASASASYRSALGEIRSSWSRQGTGMLLTVQIPAGADAEVVLPDAAADGVTESGRKLTEAEGVSHCAARGNALACVAGSGTYRFAWRERRPGSGRSADSALFTLHK